MTEIFQWRFIATACFCLFNTLIWYLSVWVSVYECTLLNRSLQSVCQCILCILCVSNFCLNDITVAYKNAFPPVTVYALNTLRPEVKLLFPASCTLVGRLCQYIKNFSEKNNWSEVMKTSYIQLATPLCPRRSPFIWRWRPCLCLEKNTTCFS